MSSTQVNAAARLRAGRASAYGLSDEQQERIDKSIATAKGHVKEIKTLLEDFQAVSVVYYKGSYLSSKLSQKYGSDFEVVVKSLADKLAAMADNARN